ncbi:hypothetical protein GALMADRAFT_229571 [Galerina marginata CBS 339.88]|uniref:Heterokaryon incompatibility domain-containing protein n=1 Tax=Galerina marginata (strain CBS 339.88) TaxID=685588 RepID=A0A067SL29_GALM3|nr:hypothetical protein GALMADRAFT_229571 [Galerina marginata CBS 339.88]
MSQSFSLGEPAVPLQYIPHERIEPDDSWGINTSEDEGDGYFTESASERVMSTYSDTFDYEEAENIVAAWDSPTDDEGSRVIVPPLLPVPSTLAGSDDALCSVCKDLELSPDKFIIPDSEKTLRRDDFRSNDIHLGRVEDIKKKIHCPFCRLVLKALGPDVPDCEDDEPVTITVIWEVSGFRPIEDEFWHVPQIRFLRPFAQRQGGGTVNSGKLHMSPGITLLANDAPSTAKTSFVRLINDQIDIDIVQNWISICQRFHKGCCDGNPYIHDNELGDITTEIHSFRLIDVIDSCIVLPAEGCKYAALSYVWGIDPKTILRLLKENVDELQSPGSLEIVGNKERIPLTIRDAMEVTRKLGLRYLWVDSLCIVQDDDSKLGSKMEAIAKMGLVYGASDITLIAATGINAQAGIPGLRPGTRGREQLIEEISPGCRLGAKTLWQNYIWTGVYFDRGWTFQEREFSTRSLTFIGGQVVFRCKETSGWREDVVFEDYRGAYAAQTRHRDLYDPAKVWNMEALIRNYSTLSLTFEADIYHAFAAMIQYIQREFQVILYHGIPDRYFDWFLLWKPLKAQQRRTITPSWSWSAWKGEAVLDLHDWYSNNFAEVQKEIKERTWIHWYQREAHDSKACVFISAPDRDEDLEAMHARFPFDCSQKFPNPRTILDAPRYVEDTYNSKAGSGFLQFWTVSLTFRLDKPTRSDSPSRVIVFGQNDKELGTVPVQPEWETNHVPGQHEFIILCEGRDGTAYLHDKQIEDGWKYKMMLIEWHGDWAERIGISSIRKEDIFQSLGDGPTWKEIVLG